MAGLEASLSITRNDVQQLVMSTGHSLQAAITATGFGTKYQHYVNSSNYLENKSQQITALIPICFT